MFYCPNKFYEVKILFMVSYHVLIQSSHINIMPVNQIMFYEYIS